MILIVIKALLITIIYHCLLVHAMPCRVDPVGLSATLTLINYYSITLLQDCTSLFFRVCKI